MDFQGVETQLAVATTDAWIERVIADRYRVERVLARGGMATVYEATHLTTGHKVALKLLHPHYAENPGVVARFMNEARAAATLRHPHIARCDDAGVADGRPFLVMELLDGRDLAQELHQQRQLAPERACEIARQIAAALGFAHAAGIIHRDLKPENVFLTDAPDGSVRVKLLDFGIARFSLELKTQGTRTGTAMGTPLYMAPEQFRDASRVDSRADVFALALVLYEMLAGRSPFDADNLPEHLAQVSAGRFTPIESLRPEVPAHIAGAIARGLEPHADKRTASVERFVAELDDPSLAARPRGRLLPLLLTVVLGLGAAVGARAILLNRNAPSTRVQPIPVPTTTVEAWPATRKPTVLAIEPQPTRQLPPSPAAAAEEAPAAEAPSHGTRRRGRSKVDVPVPARRMNILDEPDF